jgi:hypothetical protein
VKSLHLQDVGFKQSNDQPRLWTMVFISIFVVVIDQEDS